MLTAGIFTIVNFSSLSYMICSNGDTACCKMKAENSLNEHKSCCETKKIERYSSNCLCIIKEVNKEPAELSHSNYFTSPKVFSDLKLNKIENQLNLNKEGYTNSFIKIFSSPPNEDINLLKCVLRI